MRRFIQTLIVILLPFNNMQIAISQQIVNDVNQADSSILLDIAIVEAYQIPGKLHNIPGSLSVLQGKSLNIGDNTNLASILNTMPGVTMQSGTYATNRIVIRGMGSRTPYNTNRIKSYLNDIPLTSSDGVSTPEEIDIQSLARIEILKGPSSALYGSGLGGSINMFTPNKKENEANLSAQYGNYNTYKTNLAGTIQNSNVNLWANLSHLQSDGYRENNQYKKTSLLSTMEWLKPKWSINSTLLLIYSNAGIPSSLGKTQFENNPQSAAANWNAVGGYKKNQKGVIGITLKNKLTKQLNNQLSIYGKWNDGYEKRPFNNLDDQSLGLGFRNKLSLSTSNSDLILGTEFNLEQYEWKLDLEDSLINKNRENRQHLNIFGIWHYRPNPKLNISIAGAMNYINYQLTDLYDANGNQAGSRKFPVIVSPRFGINYAPNQLLAFYSSIGHGFSMPSPEETLLPAGDVNTEIKPEQGFQYEIGSRFNLLGKTIEIDVSLYWIELHNLLVTKRYSEDIFTGINTGKTRHQGFELLLQNRFFEYNNFPGKLKSVVNYTLSLNKFIDFTDDGNVYDNKHLPGIPKQMVQLQLVWNPIKKLEIYTNFQYTDFQYLNDNNSLTYPSYFLWNLKGSMQFSIKKSIHLNLHAGINNITNTHYASMLVVNAIGFGANEPRYYYPGLPRNLYLGIQFQF